MDNTFNKSDACGAGILFIVSGPSGVGKTTLITEFLKKHKDELGLKKLISYTSRTQRDCEVDGVDYHFLSSHEFKDKIGQGFFVEWIEWGGHYYGISQSLLNDLIQGQSYIGALDRNGAKRFVGLYRLVVLVWITVTDIVLLQERLHKRGTESLEVINQRLAIARKEIEQEQQESLYQYHIDNIIASHAIKQLYQIVTSELLKAEKKP